LEDQEGVTRPIEENTVSTESDRASRSFSSGTSDRGHPHGRPLFSLPNRCPL